MRLLVFVVMMVSCWVICVYCWLILLLCSVGFGRGMMMLVSWW